MLWASAPWDEPWRSLRPQWRWHLSVRWPLNSPMRSCWSDDSGNTSYESTPNRCSLWPTSRYSSVLVDRYDYIILSIEWYIDSVQNNSHLDYPPQIDVYINEPPGISLLEVKGGLKLNDAMISTIADSTKEVGDVTRKLINLNLTSKPRLKKDTSPISLCVLVTHS